MRRIVPIAFAIALTTSAGVSAQNQPSAGLPGGMDGITTNEAFHSYSIFPATASPKEVLAQLNRVCESKRRFDRQRCADAWRIIHEGQAKLEAKRAKRG